MKNARNSVPQDIYVGFVRSLFNDPGILLIGGLCQGLIALLVYRTTESLVYAGLAAALFLSAFYRYWTIRRVQKTNGIVDVPSARRAERSYIVGGAVQGACAGAFCFTSIVLIPDAFGELAAVAVIMGGSVTIVGRNYGSKRMVAVLAVTGVLPIALGLILKGDLNYFVLGLYIIPFMFIIAKMAENVRTMLFAAISEERNSKYLAQRFDRALNTMPHGLVMLSPEGKAVVANSQAASALGFEDASQLQNRTLKALLLRVAASGRLSTSDANFADVELMKAIREGRERKLLLKLTDGRYLEFAARSGRDELGVITFEEVTQRVESEDKIRYMARYDGLTGLPNREYFNELVADAVAVGDRRRTIGLVVFDLDDFKTVNDTLGHPVGDGLIYAVAEKLRQFESEDIVVSRFGGDEFAIYFDDIHDHEAFATRMSGIFAALKGDVDVAGHALLIQASAGAVLSPVHGADVDGMVVKADLALYRAKELGKASWHLFEDEMDQAFRRKQLLKADLRAAIAAKGLRVVYQPIVAMETMQISTCEALCRWDHPELGPISPAVFIPLAEEMGIVSEISHFVLEAATLQCARWPEHIGVSVNLSAKDFRSADIIDHVRRALDRSGLCPRRLEIEVTETALLDDKAMTRRYIEEMKTIGVRIALDDFGTGYSSLSYLHTLPLDKIKIDRSFLIDVTQNDRALELLRGIVNMSRPLGLTVTIEGVETFEQLKTLAEHIKPDLLQGFLFGAALTASGIETMAHTTWPFAKELKSVRWSDGRS